MIESSAQRSEEYARFAEVFCYPDSHDVDDSAEQETVPSGSAYLSAFDPAVSKNACSLNESAYVKMGLNILHEDLIRFYAFFGLRRLEDSELPDHLTVELEFMHYLTHLEYQAEMRHEATDSLRTAQHDFLTRHVSRLSEGLKGAYKSDNIYYKNMLSELQAFIERELTELARKDAACLVR